MQQRPYSCDYCKEPIVGGHVFNGTYGGRPIFLHSSLGDEVTCELNFVFGKGEQVFIGESIPFSEFEKLVARHAQAAQPKTS